MPILRLPTELRERCVNIARAALPNEACALLEGVDHGPRSDLLSITGIHPVTNTRRSPTAFALDGAEMIAAEERIGRGHGRVVGVLHSHPTSQAFPSCTDLADALRYDPAHRWVQLIVSMQGFTPTIRAFRYGATHDEVVEIGLESPSKP